MTEERIEYLYDKHGNPVFEIAILSKEKQYAHVCCDFRVRQITGWEVDTNEPVEDCIEDYLELAVKWDGCSHYRVGEIDEDGSRDAYLHLCGGQYFQYHADLLNYLYNLAFKEMGREPLDGDEWEPNMQELNTERSVT